MKSSFKRYLVASWRDVRVLFREFRVSLVLFVGVLLVGAIILDGLYVSPRTGRGLSFSEALHAVFTLIFFETSVDFPDVWYLQLFFFVVPLVGLGVIAEGVIRFGVTFFGRRTGRREWQVALASTCKNHIVVCGLGRDGSRVVEQLLKFDEEVVGIERSPEGQFVESIRKMGVPVIIGDARRREMLVEAGVERACAIVICTEDDLANLAIALEARELKSDIRVVMRMFDGELAKKVEKGFDIHAAFSTSALAAPAFAAAATQTQITHSFYIDDELLNVSEIKVQPASSLVDKSLAELEAELDFSVILYRGREGIDLHPDPQIRLHGDDRIVVFASLDVLNRLAQLNKAQVI
ncbi:MAG: TrkA family potassium uptake protein [Anaerolineae bacterium]